MNIESSLKFDRLYTWGLALKSPTPKVDSGSNLMHYVLSVNLPLLYMHGFHNQNCFFVKKKETF